MSFQERTQNGQVLGAFQSAVTFGALWAIGSAWSTFFRQAVLLLVATDSVGAELLAAMLTTLFGVGVAFVVERVCRCQFLTKLEPAWNAASASRPPRT